MSEAAAREQGGCILLKLGAGGTGARGGGRFGLERHGGVVAVWVATALFLQKPIRRDISNL
eukprot:3819343-Pleurochrysis_carterae.AAC.1